MTTSRSIEAGGVRSSSGEPRNGKRASAARAFACFSRYFSTSPATTPPTTERPTKIGAAMTMQMAPSSSVTATPSSSARQAATGSTIQVHGARRSGCGSATTATTPTATGTRKRNETVMIPKTTSAEWPLGEAFGNPKTSRAISP